MAELIIPDRYHEEQRILLNGNVFTIGRKSEEQPFQYSLGLKSNRVSRPHCFIFNQKGRYYVGDFGSKNHTYVGDIKALDIFRSRTFQEAMSNYMPSPRNSLQFSGPSTSLANLTELTQTRRQCLWSMLHEPTIRETFCENLVQEKLVLPLQNSDRICIDKIEIMFIK